jgi:xanthine/uracil permease
MAGNADLYGLEGRPKLAVALLLGAQHAIVALVFLVYPLAAAQQIGLDALATSRFLTACILGIGAATCLHAFRRPIGSGSLAIEIPTPVFLPAAVFAGGMGGLQALAAVSLLCGAVEIAFASSLTRVRRYFPAEVCGIAVMMLGVSIIKPAMLNAVGADFTGGGISGSALVAAATTLTTIVAISMLGSPRWRLMAIAVGLVVGVITAWGTGNLDSATLSRISSSSWVAWPAAEFRFPRIEWSLLPLALVMALVVSIDNVGMLIGIQRQIDPEWRRINSAHASAGVKVSGVGDIVAGLFGGMPTGISSANVALAHATGAIARVLSLFCGLILLLSSFSPRLIAALSLVPRPVVGAIMVYSAVYMVVSGMTLIHDRLLSERRIFVVGFSLVLGLTSALLPAIYRDVPALVHPILVSPLAVSTLIAVVLTRVLSIGLVKKCTLDVQLSETVNESLQEYEINRAIRGPFEALGAAVGAAREFIDRGIDVTSEYLAALRKENVIRSGVHVTAQLEEDRLSVSMTYSGDAPRGDYSRVARHMSRLSVTERDGEVIFSLAFEE